MRDAMKLRRDECDVMKLLQAMLWRATPISDR